MLLISTVVSPASRANVLTHNAVDFYCCFTRFAGTKHKAVKPLKHGEIKYIRGHETQTREVGKTTIETE